MQQRAGILQPCRMSSLARLPSKLAIRRTCPLGCWCAYPVTYACLDFAVLPSLTEKKNARGATESSNRPRACKHLVHQPPHVLPPPAGTKHLHPAAIAHGNWRWLLLPHFVTLRGAGRLHCLGSCPINAAEKGSYSAAPVLGGHWACLHYSVRVRWTTGFHFAASTGKRPSTLR